MENCQSSNPAPKVLPQKYLKFMAFIHYYNQHLVDNNISTREELDNLLEVDEKGKVIKRGAIFMKTGIMGTETFYELLRDNLKSNKFVIGKLKSRDDSEVIEEREVDLKTLMKMELMKKIEGTASLSSPPTEGGRKRKSRKLKKSSKRKSRKARKSHKKRR